MKPLVRAAGFLLIVLAVAPRLVSDDLIPKKGLTLAIAKQLVAAAEKDLQEKVCRRHRCR